LTPTGLKLGVLRVKLRTRFLGPLVSVIDPPRPHPATRKSSSLEAAYRELDAALNHLSEAMGLTQAA
jgi:hypothetical protein